MAMKVERQIKRSGNTHFLTNSASSSLTLRLNLKRDGGLSNQSLMQRLNHLTQKRMLIRIGKVNLNLNLLLIEILNVLILDLSVQNRRVMLTRDKSESEEMPDLMDCSDEEITYPVEGEDLVIRHALNMQIKEDDVEQQWENIFHTRCHIQNKVCSMIIDGGSCANVASDNLVKKLNLSCIKHLRPYRLQWLNKCGEVQVTKQVLIAFVIEKYSDEVMCDVVPIHASYLLLGRSWQFDRKTIHDGFRNRFTIVKDGKTITLAPLSPKQVYDD